MSKRGGGRTSDPAAGAATPPASKPERAGSGRADAGRTEPRRAEPGRSGFELAGVHVPPGSRAVVDVPVSVLSDHTPITLSVHVIHGRRDGPTVFISAAIHGDEIIGVEIIRRLIRSQQMRSLAGTLLCIPIVNSFGFLNHDRYLPDRRDLNRSFPGAASGSLAARLARLFMDEIVSRCEAGIDLHSASAHRVNLPQIRIDSRSNRARELADAFAPPVILPSKLRDGSLRLAARQAGVDVLVYEAGEALRFDETAVRIGVRGSLRVLHKLGMLASDRGLTPAMEPRLARGSAWLRAPMGGILRAHKTIGSSVEAGEAVAMVSDPFGESEEAVTADVDGVIIGRTNLPIVNEGDALFHVAEVPRPAQMEQAMDKLSGALDGDPLFDEDEII